MKRALVVSAAAVVLAALARGEVRLCEIFGDSMILQRDRAIPVWGEAEPGESISVTIGERKASAIAGPDGRWSVKLDPLAAGGPYELVVAGANEIRVHDVLVGEVWVCAGQSNMGWPLALSDGGENEINKSKSRKLRFFEVALADSRERAYHLKGAWQTATPQALRSISGVAWFFGHDLETSLDVPIGLVQMTSNGSPAEPWTERKAMEADPELLPALKRWARKEKSSPGALFNGMIGPLAPFAIRGVVWYQGESNCAQAFTYRKLLPTLIQSWRALWGQGDFWFLIVQLPGFGPKPEAPGESEWAELREAQSKARALPNVAMCVTIDLGAEKDLHPTDKRDVGKRMALVAREKVYAQKVESSGPTLSSFEVAGREARLRFDHAEGGLRLASGGRVQGFAIAGADRKWYWADGKIDGATITLRSPKVDVPVAVRYAWSDDPICNLQNAAGLPAEPFRTDDWPASTVPSEQPSEPKRR